MGRNGNFFFRSFINKVVMYHMKEARNLTEAPREKPSQVSDEAEVSSVPDHVHDNCP